MFPAGNGSGMLLHPGAPRMAGEAHEIVQCTENKEKTD